MKPELEDQLSDYLRDMREADLKGTLRHISDQLVAHEAKDDVRHAEVLGQIRGHSLRIGELERDKSKLEDRVGDTGRWLVEDLKEKHRKSKDLALKLIFAVGGALLGAIGILLSLLWK